jgi:hypothetical protein
MLTHAGSVAGAYLPGTRRFERGYILPELEAGEYGVCELTNSGVDLLLSSGVAPAGACVSGFLPPLGELTVKLPKVK